MAGVFLGSIPGAYFNAVLICFFVNLFRQHGLVFNPVKAMKLIWPVFKAMLLGFIPAAIASTVIQQLVPSLVNAPLLIVPLGALVSAVLLHRMFLTEIGNTRNWNIAVAILAVVQIALLGFSLSHIQN